MLYFPVKKKIIRRHDQHRAAPALAHLPKLLQRIYAARQLTKAEELDRSLTQLPSPLLFSGMENLVAHLEDVIRHQRKLLIIADYDADGATACSVALLGLGMLGAEQVDYLVPSRFGFGYGLSPELVRVAAKRQPDVLLTVDNGISSIEGTHVAKALGMRVLITDHHLPGQELPAADAIVNPNLPGDEFPSRSLAGVGVMFYVLMALRQRLRNSGWFEETGRSEPNLGQLLDLVALGTVADVVTLDHVNRILVHQGLLRIRKGQARPGILALIEVAGRKYQQSNATELGFTIAPRLNAAGRLEDMSLGIECLLSDDTQKARELAQNLDRINRERREIEEQMKRDALHHLDTLNLGVTNQSGICLFDAGWHQGVIGILASRIKDRYHRPVIAFAPGDGNEIKGSARSMEGVHIRDVLSDIATAHPTLLKKFGGHAMAAGLSLRAEDYSEFARLFDQHVATHLAEMDLERTVVTDGALDVGEIALSMAETLEESGPWGQGFPEPLFDGEFEVLSCRVLKEKHLKFQLKLPDQDYGIDGIAFSVDNPEAWLSCSRLRLAYRLDINEYRDNRGIQLRIEYMEAAA